MAIDRRVGTKVDKTLRREEAIGTRVDPYPYIGIVKNNLDPTRSGRVQVYIPDFGGDSEDKKNWRTVGYASPFMGYTNYNDTTKSNSFEHVAHTYGMWMVPPDIGVKVICIFIAGDPQKGYWIACVNTHLSHYMVPGLASSSNVDIAEAPDDAKKSFVAGRPYPVTEFNENEGSINTGFNKNNKPLHEVQYAKLKQQGLDRDPVRGVISSSSQRESPSHVFGISTPGRPTNDPALDDPAYLKKINDGTLNQNDYAVKSRKGGHTFVMDDGDAIGNDQLLRLRTSKGHQIMMNDSYNTLYISHADGSSWVELTADGQVQIFAAGAFSVRAQGAINLHSEASINLHAANNISMKAGNKIQFESARASILAGTVSINSSLRTEFLTGAFNVSASAGISLDAGSKIALNAGSGITQNSGGAATVNPVRNIPEFSHPDAKFNSELGVWINTAKALSSITTVVPSHEPHFRGVVPAFVQAEVESPPAAAPDSAPTVGDATNPIAGTARLGAGANNSGVQPKESYSGGFDATKIATGEDITNPASEKELRDQPAATEPVGPLSVDDMTAVNAQLGNNESSEATTEGLGNGQTGYEFIGEDGNVGKYQFDYQNLKDAGYLKSNVEGNADLNNPNSWIGGTDAEGNPRPNNLSEFLQNSAQQETLIEKQNIRNYGNMVESGAITADMEPSEVAGMLCVAHQFGPDGATEWRQTDPLSPQEQAQRILGGTGNQYFQMGKYAVTQLAPLMPEIKAG